MSCPYPISIINSCAGHPVQQYTPPPPPPPCLGWSLNAILLQQRCFLHHPRPRLAHSTKAISSRSLAFPLESRKTCDPHLSMPCLMSPICLRGEASESPLCADSPFRAARAKCQLQGQLRSTTAMKTPMHFFDRRVLKPLPDMGNGEMRELAATIQRDIYMRNPNVRCSPPPPHPPPPQIPSNRTHSAVYNQVYGYQLWSVISSADIALPSQPRPSLSRSISQQTPNIRPCAQPSIHVVM